MKRPYQFRAVCLACGHKGMVLHDSKEDYQEVTVCPKCNGAFVDTWKVCKYKQSDLANEIEIIMTDVNKPPKVILNGEPIKGIVEIHHNYVSGSPTQGQHNFTVKYMDETTNTIRTVSANKLWEGQS